jgi:hypothetical protein
MTFVYEADSPMTKADQLDASVKFLRSIGLELIESDNASGFLDTIKIDAGKIYYQPGKTSPANILHEAGHLAVLPLRYRARAGECVDDVICEMCDEMGEMLAADPDLSPDAPEMRAIMQAGETEATAWAFAAGRAIGLPDHVIIEDQDYDGEGEGIRFGLALNAYVGINGMVRGGMCESVKAYPARTKWLQD